MQEEFTPQQEATWVVRRMRYFALSDVIEEDRKVAREAIESGVAHVTATIAGYEAQIEQLNAAIAQAKDVIAWQHTRLAQIDEPFNARDKAARAKYRIDEIHEELMVRWSKGKSAV